MVIKRKRERTLFELPRPQKRVQFLGYIERRFSPRHRWRPRRRISLAQAAGRAGGLSHPQPLRVPERHICPALAALTRESADCAGFFSCTPAGSPAGTAKRTANIRFIRIERQKYESGRIFALQFAPALLPGRGRRRAPGSRLRPIGRWPLCSLRRFRRNRVWRLGSKDMRRKTRRGQVVRGQEHIGSACAGRKRFLRLGR